MVGSQAGWPRRRSVGKAVHRLGHVLAGNSGTAAWSAGASPSMSGASATGCCSRSLSATSPEKGSGAGSTRAAPARANSPSDTSLHHRAWRASKLGTGGSGRPRPKRPPSSNSSHNSALSPSSHLWQRRMVACAPWGLRLEPQFFRTLLRLRLRLLIASADGFCALREGVPLRGDRVKRHNTLRTIVASRAASAGLSPEVEKLGLLPPRPATRGARGLRGWGF